MWRVSYVTCTLCDVHSRWRTFNVTYIQCDVPSNVTYTFNLTCILCDVCLPFDTKRFYTRRFDIRRLDIRRVGSDRRPPSSTLQSEHPRHVYIHPMWRAFYVTCFECDVQCAFVQIHVCVCVSVRVCVCVSCEGESLCARAIVCTLCVYVVGVWRVCT